MACILSAMRKIAKVWVNHVRLHTKFTLLSTPSYLLVSLTFWWISGDMYLDQNPARKTIPRLNNVATQLPLHLAVFPVLITSYSSSVEKHGSTHWNIHTNETFRSVKTTLIVTGQEKPHMCIWPLNMNLLSNKKKTWIKLVSYMLQGHNLMSRNP